jgi:L-fuconolactonase
MKVDAHQHFWNPARGDYGWMNGPGLDAIRRQILPAEFETHRKNFEIDKTVLVQAAPTVNETEYLLGLADATDFVATIVGWVDFESRDDLRHLQRLAKHPKFSGVRPMIQDLPDPEWMHRPEVQWAFEALIDLDLTFDALGFPIHLVPFLRLFEKFPQLRAVIDHCMKPRIRDDGFDQWEQGIAKIAKETPIFCKLSGLITEAGPTWSNETLKPYSRHVIESFGSTRVMWGSDWPVLELNGTYKAWHNTAEAMVDVKDHDQIFGKTAENFYRIINDVKISKNKVRSH